MNQSNIPLPPSEIRALPQWLAWVSAPGGSPYRYPNGAVTKEALKAKLNGKPHKLPIDPHRGGPAQTNARSTWTSFGRAAAAVQKWHLSGVGFVFTTDDPFAGVDLDDCRDRESGQLAAWAQRIVATLNSYTEVSPSGTGVKIWILAKLPPGGRQRAYDGGAVEMWDQGRYFAFTGLHMPGTPRQVLDAQSSIERIHARLFETQRGIGAFPAPAGSVDLSDDEILARAKAAKNGWAFERLWCGDIGQHKSPSEADAALCARLAFWTRDPEKIDRLFRRSGLMRDKWEQPGYAKRTVELALETVREFYRPKGSR